MGTDKAFVEVAGVPMAERVAGSLAAAGCEPVVFVGGDTALLARFGRPVHVDRFPDQGPGGGVVTALNAVEDDIVIAACDLPLLSARTVSALIAAVTDDIDVVVAATDRMQPALAWWSAASRPVVERLWAEGRRSLHELVESMPMRAVTVDAVSVRNVNTAGELADAEALLGTLAE
jgi:molybdenum cofactor guanylyltransferase